LETKGTVSGALWMSVFAGLGAVVVETILVGSLYLFEPVAKAFIEKHSTPILLCFPLIFVAGFGLSLQFSMEMQFWRGKWK
jgi:Kef-type K+ transport system membrane component KefB